MTALNRLVVVDGRTTAAEAEHHPQARPWPIDHPGTRCEVAASSGARISSQDRHDLRDHLELPAPRPASPRRGCSARLRSPVTANSRPMMIATIQAGARSSCTSEMSAADDEQLVGERIDQLPERRDLLAPPREVAVEPVGERREAEDGRRRRSRCGTPSTAGPSNFVSSTTTSSGTRKMRVSVSEFGRFMERRQSRSIGTDRISSLVAMKAILLAGARARGCGRSRSTRPSPSCRSSTGRSCTTRSTC